MGMSLVICCLSISPTYSTWHLPSLPCRSQQMASRTNSTRGYLNVSSRSDLISSCRRERLLFAMVPSYRDTSCRRNVTYRAQISASVSKIGRSVRYVLLSKSEIAPFTPMSVASRYTAGTLPTLEFTSPLSCLCGRSLLHCCFFSTLVTYVR